MNVVLIVHNQYGKPTQELTPLGARLQQVVKGFMPYVPSDINELLQDIPEPVDESPQSMQQLYPAQGSNNNNAMNTAEDAQSVPFSSTAPSATT